MAVIGGGLTGLATAWRLAQDADPGRVAPLLVEAAPRLGGKVVSERDAGFVLEAGADAVVAQKPQALELARALGLGDQVLPSDERAGGVSIWHRGRLVPLPAGLRGLVPRRWGPLLASPLFSPWGKLRFLAEPWLPPRRAGDGDDAGDESVADLVRRRLGREVLARLGEPLLAHLHAADAERLSVRAAWPQLAALEAGWGSLRRGVRAQTPAAAPAPPAFWTLRHGLGGLVDALAEALPAGAVLRGQRAVGLARAAAGAGWRVRLDDGRELAAAAVVLAVPAAAAAELLAGVEPVLSARLRAFRAVSLATLNLAWRRADLAAPLYGSGFLVPRAAGLPLLGATFCSNKFAGRAPDDRVLVRAFLGGDGNEELLASDDDALTTRLAAELRRLLGLRGDPVLARLHRWPQGYPQYDVGHLDRVAAATAALPPGLLLAGSAYHGVGLSDCVASGFAAAARALAAAAR